MWHPECRRNSVCCRLSEDILWKLESSLALYCVFSFTFLVTQRNEVSNALSSKRKIDPQMPSIMLRACVTAVEQGVWSASITRLPTPSLSGYLWLSGHHNPHGKRIIQRSRKVLLGVSGGRDSQDPLSSEVPKATLKEDSQDPFCSRPLPCPCDTIFSTQSDTANIYSASIHARRQQRCFIYLLAVWRPKPRASYARQVFYHWAAKYNPLNDELKKYKKNSVAFCSFSFISFIPSSSAVQRKDPWLKTLTSWMLFSVTKLLPEGGSGDVALQYLLTRPQMHKAQVIIWSFFLFHTNFKKS